MHGLRTAALLGTVFPLLVGTGAHGDTRAPGDLVPAALTVDAQPNGGASDGNGLLEPGETVVAAPSWRNTTAGIITAGGAASAFGGPGSPGLYAVPDPTSSYTVPAGQTASCAATGNCLALSVAPVTPRPATHWDATFGESLTSGSTKTWTVHVGQSYPDVPRANIFYRFVETLLHRGVEGGCPAGSYCPTAPMTRDWMAPFVLTTREGRFFIPPACRLGEEMFADVPATSPNCRWIEELARRGVVTGCGGGSYCPGAVVSREQMAVFILVTREGSSYAPPACVAGSERFADVPASSPFCRWIEELARRNVVTGCSATLYCPTPAVSREQMSVFLSVTFGLERYGPAPDLYLVNTADDVNDGACTPAHCSLREAIAAANAAPNPAGGRQEIHFRIPGSGPQVVAPTSGLPAITDAVVVDGYTQPGASPNTRGFGSGLDSVLAVELNLAGAGGALTVSTTNVLLRGLAVNRSPGHGIALEGGANAIEGCFIGTDATGTVNRGNAAAGVLVGMGRNANRIGGTAPIQRNLISGSRSGIGIESGNANLIQGNLVGTNRAGQAPIANTTSGVYVVSVTHLAYANDNVIGGLEYGAGNAISGGQTAISLSGYVGASLRIVGNTRIQGNLLGLDAAGAAPLPTANGIFLDASGVWDTLVGGLTAAPAGNSIAAAATGVVLNFGINGGPHRTRIQGNLIRSSTFGVRGYPNAGGDVTGNVIGPNASSGIYLDGGQLRISANSIAGNGGLGIDLAPAGVTPNDPGDGDAGPNALQNYPVLTSAVTSGGVTTVTGTLGSAANTTYTVELFESPAPHVTGFGEGAIYRGFVAVTTNASGTAAIAFAIPAAIPPGRVITATATDPAGNTSEFSNAVVVTQ